MEANPITAILALIIALFAGLCAPGADHAAAPTPEKVLTLRYWQAPTVPMPYLSDGDKDADAAAVTLEPLANYAPDGSLIPRLAEAIPTRENGGISPDLMRITWQLRDNLRWSDGSPLTAADVEFSYRYCTQIAANHCVQQSRFAGVDRVETRGPRAITIIFDAPTPYPYTAFVGAKTPIISQAQFDQCADAPAHCPHNLAPLGSGPYRITHFDAAAGAAEYERNPHYRGAPAYFDRVILRGGGTAEDAARAVLQDSTADYAWNLQIPPQQLAHLQAAGAGQPVAAFASVIETIAVNQTNPDPALADNRSEYLNGENPHPFLTFPPIPQAMSLAIDRAHLAETLYGFAARPACNLIDAPPPFASAANNACLTQDIPAANRLLDANGVTDTDNDGIREYNGIPLRLTYQTTANNPVRQETQRLIAGWWQEIGIDAQLLTHPAADFFGGDPLTAAAASYRRFFADVQMYADGPAIDPQQYLANHLCAQIQTRANGWTTANNTRACNPQYDALHAQLSQTPTGPARQQLARQLNDIIIQNRYQIPLVNRGKVSAHAKNLQNVQPNAWDTDLWNLPQWRRPPTQ